ncbi:hypothetical protein B0H11DRAFT_2325847 [Mycena galericulata]|nr:hypothetical protein B0H11DRAFT_2325847 [Mycena galericulata]
MKTWLQRSRKHPSSVRLSSDFKEGAAPIIRLYGQQLKHLEVCYEKEDDKWGSGYIDILGCASAGPLPLLETLTIRSHTNLDDPRSGDGILRHLTLPRLETLSLSMYVLYGPDLLSFLKRSSPPLRELVLGVGCENGDVTCLEECLRLVPTLMRFELWWPEGSTFEQFFAAWADSSSNLLPNLRSLIIRFLWSTTILDFSWEALLRALAARRTKIRTIRIDLCSISSKPAPHILAAFEELVTDGMEVYIGTKIQNFCAV